MNGAKDAEVGSEISFKTRLAKNLLASGTWLRMLRLVAIVIMVIIKQSKDHLFLRSQTYLQSILPFYTLEKDEFLLIFWAMIEALS